MCGMSGHVCSEACVECVTSGSARRGGLRFWSLWCVRTPQLQPQHPRNRLPAVALLLSRALGRSPWTASLGNVPRCKFMPQHVWVSSGLLVPCNQMATGLPGCSRLATSLPGRCPARTLCERALSTNAPAPPRACRCPHRGAPPPLHTPCPAGSSGGSQMRPPSRTHGPLQVKQGGQQYGVRWDGAEWPAPSPITLQEVRQLTVAALAA